MKRRVLGLSTVAIAMLLILSSAAFACTYVSGQTYFHISGSHYTSAQGSAGSSATLDAHNVSYTSQYYAVFFLNHQSDQDSMQICMGNNNQEQQISNWQYVTSSTIPAQTVQIPSNATLTQGDVAHLCHLSYATFSDGTEMYGTNSATMAIV